MSQESFKTRLFRFGMNIYPMYFGTGGTVLFIKHNWQHATVGLKLNLFTRNYVGTIFGGSQFAALDPFHTVLLINCLGKEYIVWDKAGAIKFKKPGKGKLKAEVIYTDDELANIRKQTAENGKYEFVQSVNWIDAEGDVVSTLDKTVYVATKEYFKKRKQEREQQA